MEHHEHETGHLPPSHLEAVPPSQIPSGEDSGLPWVIEFRLVGTTVTIQARVTPLMTIGREDPDHNIFPEIDLAPYGAYTRGVSRHHAQLIVKEGGLFIKDVFSTNGTRLNDYKLMPDHEYPLKHGDDLVLGQCHLQVLFRVAPDSKVEHTEESHKHDTLLIGKSILIVEDDEDVGLVFKIGLEKAGCDVTLVTNGSEAINHVNRQMPDAMVLDLMMPEVNGLDFIRYVRKIDTHVPLLVVSAATGGFQMNKAIETGADAFVGKPISIHDLVKALGQLVASKR